MILAIVGSRVFANSRGLWYARVIVAAEVRHARWRSFVTGDAEGVDAICREQCKAQARECEVFRPQNRRWSPEGFRVRNMLLAQACTHLLAIRDPHGETYGSGWTAEYAESLGKKVTRIEIS
jgi:hypothetical protein